MIIALTLYRSKRNFRKRKLPQEAVKDIIYSLRWAILWLLNGRRPETILFYPQFPDWNSYIHQVLFPSRYYFTSNPEKKFDYIVFWQDSTYRHIDKILERLSVKFDRITNLNCLDISKSAVEEHFVAVFGYRSFVDPLCYRGLCVEKSAINATHDGRLMECPIDKSRLRKECVYQKLLENKVDDQTICDYRVLVIDNEIYLSTIRYRSKLDRFDQVLKIEKAENDQLFAPEEIYQILLLCQRMNLDYGDLDIIRNDADGRIYIIDVNNTPHRPPYKMRNREVAKYERKVVNKALISLITKTGARENISAAVQRDLV